MSNHEVDNRSLEEQFPYGYTTKIRPIGYAPAADVMPEKDLAKRWRKVYKGNLQEAYGKVVGTILYYAVGRAAAKRNFYQEDNFIPTGENRGIVVYESTAVPNPPPEEK